MGQIEYSFSVGLFAVPIPRLCPLQTSSSFRYSQQSCSSRPQNYFLVRRTAPRGVVFLLALRIPSQLLCSCLLVTVLANPSAPRASVWLAVIIKLFVSRENSRTPSCDNQSATLFWDYNGPSFGVRTPMAWK